MAPPHHGRFRGPNFPMPSEVLSETDILVIKIDSWPAGRGRERQILWCLGTFADPALGLVLVKAGLGAQLGLSHVQPSSAEATKNWIVCSFKEAAECQTWTACDVSIHQLHTTLEQYPKEDFSRQGLHSAETNSTLLFFIIFYIFLFHSFLLFFFIFYFTLSSYYCFSSFLFLFFVVFFYFSLFIPYSYCFFLLFSHNLFSFLLSLCIFSFNILYLFSYSFLFYCCFCLFLFSFDLFCSVSTLQVVVGVEPLSQLERRLHP